LLYFGDKSMRQKLILLGLLSVITLIVTSGFNIQNAYSQNTHRGRIQAQGANPKVEVSQAWTQATPLTAVDGLTKLDTVWNSLTATQQKERVQAYTSARSFIQSAAKSGGVSSSVSKTFQDPQRKDSTARIDIEVIAGTAFTP
jgi:hypothetical protein